PPGYRNLDILAGLKLDFDQDPASLAGIVQETWKNLRFQHPLLAATYDGDNFIYQSPGNEEELQQWADETFLVKKSRSTPTSCPEDVMVIDRCDHPMMAYIPEDKRVVFRMPHVYADGIGTAILSQDFMVELGRLMSATTRSDRERPFREDIQNLPLGTCVAANMPELSAEWQESVRAKLPDPKTDEAIRMPTKDDAGSNILPRDTRMQRLRFTKTETANILARARKSGLKLAPFIHATMLHAAKKLAITPEQETKNHTSFMLFNLRDRCHGTPANAAHRALDYRVAFWYSQIQLGNNLYDTASALKDHYESILQEKESRAAAHIPHCEKMTPFLGDNVQHSIMISSIGNLDPIIPEKKCGALKLDEFSVTALVTSPLLFVPVQTFAGQLEVRITYNEAYHEDSQVAELL
ncbi:hypothetical protein ASPWEDRAFT_97249, partial [Aspergillus wentii DTO 134E9]